MRRKRMIAVYVDDDEFEKLSQLSAATGLSMSDILRMCTRYVLQEVLIHRSFVEVMRNTIKETTEKGGE